MGFAHVMGVIDYLTERDQNNKFIRIAEGNTLGRFYILAPENVDPAQEIDFTNFENGDIWQYGTDEENDDLWKQDGVAPQSPVPGLTNVNRVFIPEDDPDTEITEGPDQSFTDSHSTKNFWWVFKRPFNSEGYVKKRN